MLKSEIEILTAVALNKCTYKQIASSSMARSSPYIISTIDSLVRRGYLIKDKSKRYHLTIKGTRALAIFLPDNTTLRKTALYRLLHEHLVKAEESVNMINKLGNNYANRLDRLQN